MSAKLRMILEKRLTEEKEGESRESRKESGKFDEALASEQSKSQVRIVGNGVPFDLSELRGRQMNTSRRRS